MSHSVNIVVTSPDTRGEHTYHLSLTVGDLKRKLVSVTGIPVESQSLSLSRSESDGSGSQVLSEDERPLGFYGVTNGMHIKVTDLNPDSNMTGQFTDVSAVEKFEISKEEYEKRPDTVKAYKERNKMGRFADPPPAGTKTAVSETPPIPVGSRCRLAEEAGAAERRGTVRFVGQTKFGKQDGSIWVGIELDEPLGKNDGSVQGERYFQSPPLHGVFVRPVAVELGDYPPVDPFNDAEM